MKQTSSKTKLKKQWNISNNNKKTINNLTKINKATKVINVNLEKSYTYETEWKLLHMSRIGRSKYLKDTSGEAEYFFSIDFKNLNEEYLPFLNVAIVGYALSGNLHSFCNSYNKQRYIYDRWESRKQNDIRYGRALESHDYNYDRHFDVLSNGGRFFVKIADNHYRLYIQGTICHENFGHRLYNKLIGYYYHIYTSGTNVKVKAYISIVHAEGYYEVKKRK